MKSPYADAIEALKAAIAEKEAAFLAEIQPMKVTANELSKLAGLPELFDEDALMLPGVDEGPPLKFREDEFFNKPLAGSVVNYMEKRDEAGMERPASVDEIYDALVSGGFKFEGNTNNPDNSKRALKIALTKNTAQFVKIGEKFALKKWYSKRGGRKSSASPRKADPSPAAEHDSVPVEEFDTTQAEEHGITPDSKISEPEGSEQTDKTEEKRPLL